MITPAPHSTKRWLNRSVVVTSVAIVCLIGGLISCATMDRVVVAPPMIPGATYVGMETCGTCHEQYVKDFKLTAHSRMQWRLPEGEEVPGLGCEACHGPGSLHVEAGGGRDTFIINPNRDPAACFACHLETHAQFSLQYRHPMQEGRMTCLECHNPHGEDILHGKSLFVARVNDNCAQCHREQARPRVFEHEALREGCTTCHQPHGSINEKLLTERDNNLCLKCHAQIAVGGGAPGQILIGKRDHTGFLAQGTCWSAGCHTAMHGSDINPHLRY